MSAENNSQNKKLNWKGTPFISSLGWIVLALDLIVTLGLWYFVNESVIEDAEKRFHFRGQEIETAIQERLKAYEQVLRGGVGLFNSTNLKVDRKTFKTYVENLKIEERYRGIQGIGFAPYLSKNNKESHIQKIREEGFSNYTIRPEGSRKNYVVITYLEPFSGRNLRAFGYDMFSQPVRQRAIERAIITGQPSITGKVTLVQETNVDVQNGFLMYLPVFQKGSTPNSIQERRSTIYGFVYSPFRILDFLEGVLGQRKIPDIAYGLYDGEDIQEKTLLYASNPNHNKSTSLFNLTIPISFNGHQWSLVLGSLKSFEDTLEKEKSNAVLLAGIVVSLIFFFVLWLTHRARNNAINRMKKITKDLEENEQRLNYALESTEDGLWDWNIQTGEVYYSPRWMTMLGYKPFELEGNLSTWKKLLHPQDQEKVLLEVDKLLNGELQLYTTEQRLKTKSGDYKWILARGKIISYTANGKPLRATGLHTDISDRKLFEEEIKTRESQLQGILEQLQFYIDHAPGLISYVDSDEVFQFVNQSYLNWFEISKEEIVGKSVKSALGKFAYQQIETHLKAALSGVPQTFETEVPYKKEGTRFVKASYIPKCDTEGKVLGLFAFVFDLTSQKKVEDEIRTRESQLQGILDNSPAIIYMKDLFGRYLMINKRCEAALDLKNEDVVGKTSHEILPQSVADQFTANDRKVFETLSPLEVEETIPRPDGERIFLSVQFPLKKANGELYGICGISKDITERKNAEKLLKEYKENLEKEVSHRTEELLEANEKLKDEIEKHKHTHKRLLQMEKLSALGKLTGSIAHEFNNPIYGIKVILEQLNENVQPKGNNKRGLELAIRECDRITSLISQLRDFYKPSSHKMEWCNINNLVKDMLSLIQKKIDQKQIYTELQLARDLPKVFVVEDQIKQVLLNILHNAEESIPEFSSSKKIIIKTEFDDVEIKIHIQDFGTGISQENIDSLFDPFFTTKSTAKGTGLGLSVSHGIIEDHGGTIQVKSSPEKGATFSIILPIKSENYEPAQSSIS